MQPHERYLFDTRGYVIVKSVFTPAQVDTALQALQAHRSRWQERTAAPLRLTNSESPLSGPKGRIDVGGILDESFHASTSLFRSVLAHPRLQPYYHALCGRGYRLDHSPLVIIQRPGCEGFTFHGGCTNEDGTHAHDLSYTCNNQDMRCVLLNASVALTAVRTGEGGFVTVPGSHKANFPPPPGLLEYEPEFRSATHAPEVDAGDVILFTEAMTHGTLPWRGETDRYAALYRFSPASYAYGRAYLNWPKEYTNGMNERELAVMEAPFSTRLDRQTLPERDPEKKKFDAQVFGTQYY